MQAFAWLCIVAGTLLAIAAFVIAANKQTLNPWPSLMAGFSLTAVGVVVLAIERRPKAG